MMAVDDDERRFARAAWAVAVGLVERRNAGVRELARTALERPDTRTIRALLDAGRGTEWLHAVLDALVQIGIAGAQDILGDRN
jgi:hypothetical protein